MIQVSSNVVVVSAIIIIQPALFASWLPWLPGLLASSSLLCWRSGSHRYHWLGGGVVDLFACSLARLVSIEYNKTGRDYPVPGEATCLALALWLALALNNHIAIASNQARMQYSISRLHCRCSKVFWRLISCCRALANFAIFFSLPTLLLSKTAVEASKWFTLDITHCPHSV